MLKQLFLPVLLALAGLAMLSSSALAWTEAGNHTLTATLTSTFSTGGTLTCDLTFAVTLKADPAGTPPPNNPLSVTTGNLISNPCTTNMADCAATVALQTSTAWDGRGILFGGTTGGGSVSVRNVIFKATFESPNPTPCAVVGTVVDIGGSVIAAYNTDTGTVTFTAMFLGGDGLQITDSSNPVLAYGENDTLTGTAIFTTLAAPDLQDL